jgi:ATP-dependent Clp protease ATP-binding subunit ClpC
VRYSPSTLLVWNIAAIEAQVGRAREIEPTHMLIGLCKLCDLKWGPLFAAQPIGAGEAMHDLTADATQLRQLFERAALDPQYLRRRLRALALQEGPAVTAGQVMHRNPATRRLFRRAEQLAAGEVNSMLRPSHLLQAVLETPAAFWRPVFLELGVPNPLEAILGHDTDALRQAAENGQGRSTPYLDRFGRDLTQLASEDRLDPLIGRRAELRALVRVLLQQRKRNAILIGEAGVGKTCIVEGLAQWLNRTKVPPALKDKRVVEIGMASCLAGTKYRGEFEERLQGVLGEAAQGNDVILFIDEIHTVLGAGGEGASDAANILKPALARGELHCVGATTLHEYRRSIEQDPALERRFQVIQVEEPSREEALAILKGLQSRFEAHSGATITDAALEAAVDLSMRYLPDLRLPDKAIDLIDQACACAYLPSLSLSGNQAPGVHIDREAVAARVAERCGLPLERFTADEAKRLLHMEAVLRQRVIGQDEAIHTVAEVIRSARVGLKDPHRPVGVFLFVGSTGTGKTELAKALSEFLFDDERRLIRLDMSEYMERHTVSRLIGAPPGYIGYDAEGQLTGPVRTHPYSVVLFDEVEKAHPEVLNIFLQLFDAGRLTDAHGRSVSFTETVIILTSNLGSRALLPARAIGFISPETQGSMSERDTHRRQVLEALHESLRPELLNRIQHIVFFEPLSPGVVRQIIDKLMCNLQGQLHQHDLQLRLTEAAYTFLMEQGFDPQFGARRMERAVQRWLVQPLGKALLEDRFDEGMTVHVDVSEGALKLHPRGPSEG